MDMIEIDLQLFVTCRLCLEDKGQYQIVPSVQQQIKYCYDIDVGPFDGLPQLICTKCKEVLTNFYTTKKLLCEKQTNLRYKVSKNEINDICVQPQQDAVSSSELPSEHLEERKSTKSKRTLESSESEINSGKLTKSKKKKCVKSRVTWNYKGFKKEIICIICNSQWSNVKSFDRHKREHIELNKKYATIFDNNCSVMLEKVDQKPNMTGMDNIVVHNKRQIIEHRNPFYYVRYSKEKHSDNDASSSEGAVSDTSFKKNIIPYSSDSEQDIVAKPKRRKRRVLSQSSGDTVVIETNNKSVSEKDSKPTTQDINDGQNDVAGDGECINIDSSDSDAGTCQTGTNNKGKQPLEATHSDYKVIQGIIAMCVNAYYRKNEIEKSESNMESQLKRIVLNIGRKILTKQGSNWTGLLKYMEHKNLDIVWATKAISTSADRHTDRIRIMTKLRGTDSTSDEGGWVPVTPTEPATASRSIVASAPETRPGVALVSEPSTPSTIVSNASLRVISGSVSTVSANTTLISSPLASFVAQDLNNSQAPPDTAILFYCANPDPKSKLLNANPVANPKQLPRKAPINEVRLSRTAQVPSPLEDVDPDLCLPIITSTTSLANQPDETNHTPPAPAPSTETTVPRIKVKPVSELMSERSLNRLRQEQSASTTNNTVVNQMENTNKIVISPSVWTPPSVSNMFITNVSPQITIPNQPLQLVQLSCLNVPAAQNPVSTLQIINPVPSTSTVTKDTNNKNNKKEEFVVLNTVELPNTKTNSPFNYLKTLLLLHNLKLYAPCETKYQDYVCLLKFRVQFEQEPIKEPLFLCFSFLCLNNQFCFMIRDKDEKNVNINKIPPNFQWEIFNLFDRGDLVNKLLLNAQKQSPEIFANTNKFLCLLKSIDFKKL